MTNLQKACIALGMIGIAFLSIYLPYQVNIDSSDGKSEAYEGYYFFWSPPDPVKSCVKTFDFSKNYEERIGKKIDARSEAYWARRICSATPRTWQIVLSAAAVALVTASIFLLLGISTRKPKPFRGSD